MVAEPIVVGLRKTELEVLDLSHGSIDVIWGTLFLLLPKSLKVLYLSFNNIRYVHFKDLHKLENLHITDLSNQADTPFESKERFLPFKRALAYVSRYMKKFSKESGHDNIKYFSSTMMRKINKPDENLQHSGFQVNDTYDLCWILPLSLNVIAISNSGLLCRIVELLCHPNNTLNILKVSDHKKCVCFKAFRRVL